MSLSVNLSSDDEVNVAEDTHTYTAHKCLGSHSNREGIPLGGIDPAS